MRRALFVSFVLLAAGLAPVSTAGAQSQGPTEISLTYTLNAEEGTVDVRFGVEDPGRLGSLTLHWSQVRDFHGSVQLQGSWSSNDGCQNCVVADLRESPNAAASWVAGAQIRVETLEGEGHTSYLGPAFGVLKASDVMPGIGYSYTGGSLPDFSTRISIDAPAQWQVAAAWASVPGEEGVFQIEDPLPSGFLAADDDLEDVTLDAGEHAYRIIRVEDAQEAPETHSILESSTSFLSGVYGDTLHDRFIVTAPDPMFRGGLGNPQGVFLHDDATASVVAHEMVHAYQAWPASRDATDASVWLMEGTAVVHGTLLEVAAGQKTRQQAVQHLQEQAEVAQREHDVALSQLRYDSEHAQAMYTKGAIVVTALNDALRDTTDQEYTLADVLTELNRRASEQGGRAFGEDRALSTSEFEDQIQTTTGVDASAFFDRYVHGPSIPAMGALFPGEASVRLLETIPENPIEGEPFALRVHVSNLDTDALTVDLPLLVDGDEADRIQTQLDAGASTTLTLNLSALPEGTHRLQVQTSHLNVTVVPPPKPTVEITHFPPAPTTRTNLTLGLEIQNTGPAPYHGPLELRLDGGTILTQPEPVPSRDARTFTVTLPPLGEGTHTLTAVDPDQVSLANATLTIDPTPPNATPSPSVALAAMLVAFAAALARSHRRR